MGVLGLAPFIQKYCPDVIKELPHRLRSLSGKTIAIDGTLVTQRLHFAPMPCEHRHILGWYRLIRELKESGVGIICVFDGAKRGLAKQRENERRRKAYRMEVARGGMEAERLRRLRRLTELLKHYHVLSRDDRDHSTEALRRAVRTVPQHAILEEPLQDVVHEAPLDTSQGINESLTSESLLSGPMEKSRSTNTSTVAQSPWPKITHMFQDAAASFHIKGSALESSDNVQVNDSKIQLAKNEPISRYEKPLEEPPVIDILSTSRSQSTSLPSRLVEVLPDVLDSHNNDLNPSDDPLVPPDLCQNIDVSADSAYKLTSSALDAPEVTGEYFVENQDELSTVDPDFFETPTNVYFDISALVNATKSHAIEPPDDIDLFDGEPNMSHDCDDFDIDGNAVNSRFLPEGIGQRLLSLYNDYHQSIPAIMSSPFLDAPDPEVDSPEQEQYVMSKNQVQLTLDEGSLWRSFLSPSSQDEIDIEEKLKHLAERSEALSKSYERRTNPATTRTYEESKLILQAMGVPCVEVAVPYEAEALAVALVRHGFADYVASEDTDVLIYEAPLLRNITNRQSPLLLLSGAEIRQVLQLDRPSYVDFALLLGTDFSQRIKNLGPHRAIKLIRAHGRIEHVIANEPRFTPRLSASAYLEQVGIARLMFETLPPLPDPKLLRSMESDEKLVAAILDKFGLRRAAMGDLDFTNNLDGNYFGDNPSMY